MNKRIQIGLVGDFSEKMYTHIALNEAIAHCQSHLPFGLQAEWVPTPSINENFLAFHKFEGFWITPGSPYRNDGGVYTLIRWCRENNFPVFGSCGGFQYMIVEYARNVLQFSDAGHEESDPHQKQLVISRLSCSLRSAMEEVIIRDQQSWLFEVLGTEKIAGYFNCSYGVNPVYQTMLSKYPMTFPAFSPLGEPRALELKTHRFFKATLFQPPLDSTPEKPNPLILSFFNKCSYA